VICNERGLPTFGASAEFLGQESLFRPALNHLETNDRVGVAHWCDNGDTQLDLLPTEDRDGAIRALSETLKPIPFQGGTSESDEAGEQAFRKLIRLIIHDAYRRNPKPLPVIVFLHGDHTGQPRRELDKLVDDFLETSGVVFG
jgi:acetyl esterase/lipase